MIEKIINCSESSNWNMVHSNFGINHINENMYNNFSPSFRQLKNSVLPDLWFSIIKLFWVIFYINQKLKFFPLKEFCNNQNWWKFEDACGLVDGVEYPYQILTLYIDCKDTWEHALSKWNMVFFRFPICRCFCSTAVFNISNW